jgi:hypothetical protein
MARAYTIATAALTLQMPAKWLDNTLSHIRVSGVQQERQGVARRITVDGMLILAAAALLIKELGVPLAAAVEIAEGLVGNNGQYESPGGAEIRLDLQSLRSTVLERLENAVEIAPVPRRGRPPKTKTGRLD